MTELNVVAIFSALALICSLESAAAADEVSERMADARNWVTAAGNYASTRYSELNQITNQNVGGLKLAWSFSTGVNKGQEAAPLVIDGTMYVVSPYPNTLFALDATTGDLLWSYAPPTTPAAAGVACCDVVNRGAAYDADMVFFNTLDNVTVAVNARSGKEIWHTQLGDIGVGETMTMAPLVVRGKVLVGNSGGEMGVRGWLTALDEKTGKLVWRAYSTGPDKDVLIGADFKPHYDWMRGTDLGVSTWPPDRWQTGGGSVWGWLSYDPDLNLVYYGTGNPGPWNSNQRPGDNLWTTTIFARDPDTGMAKWAYQTAPHDLWDHDGVNELVLMNLEIDGAARHVLVRPDRTGYVDVIDRETGEILSADPFDVITSYKGVDLKTGRIVNEPSLEPKEGRPVTNICPAAPGAKDWQPSAYSPKTGLLYVPHQHLCMDYVASNVGYIAGTPFVGATLDFYAANGDDYRGEYMAWDPVSRKKAWAIHEKFPVWSGTLVTAGGIAVYGTMDRWLKIVDAKTGQLLWKTRGPSGFVGQPVTYQGSDGRQYIAILSGVGGWPGAIANAELDPRVRNGAAGFTGAVQDLPAYTQAGSTLMVFALPGQDNSDDQPDEALPASGRGGPAPADTSDATPPTADTVGRGTTPAPSTEPPIGAGGK
ncbi:Methanol dehydrogenase large subunit protein [Devosia sp. DBB001]|nr:PQQ-dependent dehydrogenase, methanol/ethanol family [Devosia sp. D6-9]CDP52991.1 Methanol dehydrogenase large subunit protein [Devosia sp. DBB001]